MRPTSRCYNCGLPGHQTQACPNYGPRYPAPGKTALDYAAEAQKIMNLVAADIVNEHNADHSEDHDYEGLSEDERERRRTRRSPAGAGGGDSGGESGAEPARDSQVLEGEIMESD